MNPIKKRLHNLFRQKYFLIISLFLIILIIGLAAYLLTSRQAGPLKEFFSPSSERQTLKQGPSFTQMISPSLIDGNKAVFYFKDSNLASEIYSQLDNAIMEDNNTIIIDGYDSSQPLVIAKSGDKPAKIFKTNGFLVELEKKSLLRQKADLSEENELNSELGKRVVSVSESMQDYAEELDDDQEKIKQEIESIIEPNNALNGRSVSSASQPAISSFKNVFNGFLVNDISYKEVSKIRSIDGVKRVIPNYQVKANLYDSVPMINAPDLWTNGYTGKGVKIAVIDTGVDYTHADLGGCFGVGCKVVGGYDFVNNDEDPIDDNGHGTHCAATAAGNGTFVRNTTVIEPLINFVIRSFGFVQVEMPLFDGDVRFGVIYGNGSHFVGIGERDDLSIAVSTENTLTYDNNKNMYFIVSNNIEKRSTVLKVTRISDIDGVSVRDYYGTYVAIDKKAGKTFYAADVEITVVNYSQKDSTVTFSIGSDADFRTLYDTNGFYFKLPLQEELPTDSYAFSVFDSSGIISKTQKFYWYNGDLYASSSGGGGGSGGGSSGGEIRGTGSGLRGVAPDAEIYAYKVLGSGGSGWTSDILAAFEKVVDPNGDGDFSDHIDVASMSFGAGCWEYDETCGPDDLMSQAVDNMVDNGVVAVVAAGNNGPGKGSIGSPGTARKAITVGAVDKQKRLASFSSRGPVSWSGGYLVKPDVVAPGVDICAARFPGVSYGSSCFDDTHLSISGTSMATPHVAGAAALLLQKNPSWNPADIKSALMIGAEKLDYETNEVGAGLIDVNKSSSLTLLISPSLISFETIVEDLPRPQKFTISNYNNYPLNISLDSDFDFTVLSENEFILEPNSSKTIWLTIFRMPDLGGLIEGNVYVNASGEIYELPFMVNLLSKVIVRVITGQSQPHFDIGIVSHNFDYWDYMFDATSPYTFLLPPGDYSVYAGGDTEDFDSVEYLMMKSFSVGNNETKNINLDISETKEITINAKSLRNTPLVLYEWEKAFTAYNSDGCKFSYFLDDPAYGDRVVHVFKKPDLFESDILFKYIGVPSLNAPLSNNPGSSRGFSWNGCYK